jgi:GMP reductase
METKLDFDDVLIVPQFSDITSRNHVKVETTIKGKWGAQLTGVPIIAANMDGVGTFSMHKALKKFNAFTAITKYHTIEQWKKQKDVSNAFITIGMHYDEIEYAKEIVEHFSNIDSTFVPKIVIDVANGYMNPFYDFVSKTRGTFPNAFIMAGTVVTPEAVVRIIEAGADLARVGIGTGAVCTTRRVTGIGYPQFSALSECVPAADSVGGGVQSDGGCVFPGDFSKALAVGSEMVMAGSVFAGHSESESEIRDGKVIFYGMSSTQAQKNHGIEKRYRASEGRIVEIPYKGTVSGTISDILGGIRSTCAYVGAKNVRELHLKAKFIKVNNQLNRSLENYTIK